MAEWWLGPPLRPKGQGLRAKGGLRLKGGGLREKGGNQAMEHAADLLRIGDQGRRLGFADDVDPRSNEQLRLQFCA